MAPLELADAASRAESDGESAAAPIAAPAAALRRSVLREMVKPFSLNDQRHSGRAYDPTARGDTVSVYVPPVTFLFELIVRVEVPAFTRDDGVNFACTNLGNPVTDKVRRPEKPWLVTVTAYVVEPVLVIVLLVGVTETEKAPTTTSVTPAVRVTGPLVPVIVRG